MLLGLMETSQYLSFNKAVSVPKECSLLLYFDTKQKSKVGRFSYEEKQQKVKKKKI